MGKKLKNAKIGKVLDAPQRYLADKVAEKAGVKKGKDSESTIHNLVQRAADKLGLPDSTATNVAKSLGVAAISTFADPNPLGKIGKGVKAVRRMTTGGRKLGGGKTAVLQKDVQGKSTLPSGAAEKAAPGAVREEKVQELGRVLNKKPENIAKKIQDTKLEEGNKKVKELFDSGALSPKNLKTPEQKKAYLKLIKNELKNIKKDM